jgi:folate-binding protein YgfZ
VPGHILLAVSGPDRDSFLQGLITNDVALLHTQPAVFSAMLSPQGKYLHEFIMMAGDGVIYIDIAAAQADGFCRKLNIYKLRAKVKVEPLPDYNLYYTAQMPDSGQFVAVADPRHSALPVRIWAQQTPANWPLISAAEAEQIRMQLAIPEGGVDITEAETALDAGYDLLGGVSFSKGCYVGQEITARMHYKAVTRKGFVQVRAAQNLPAAGSDVVAAGKKIAQVRSVMGEIGLAYGRFDDLALALNNNESAEYCGIKVDLQIPDWQQPKWQKFLTAKAE